MVVSHFHLAWWLDWGKDFTGVLIRRLSFGDSASWVEAEYNSLEYLTNLEILLPDTSPSIQTKLTDVQDQLSQDECFHFQLLYTYELSAKNINRLKGTIQDSCTFSTATSKSRGVILAPSRYVLIVSWNSEISLGLTRGGR
jgi:hypothetical protein